MNVAIVDNVGQYLGLPPSSVPPLPPRYHRWPLGTHWTLLVVRPGAYLDSLADTNTVTQLPQTREVVEIPNIIHSLQKKGYLPLAPPRLASYSDSSEEVR